MRDTLNHDCIPQLAALTGAPAWGQVADYPWTTGGSVPYDVEASIYAAKLAELKAGAKVALFYVKSDFGTAYADAFKKQAADLGLEVVDEQTIDADATDPPTAQVAAMAAKLPDAIIASPLGLQCPAFLNELANAKSQAAGWAPMVFLTNTCASKLFLGLAGIAAEGVYTSSNLLDANDPKNAAQPGVKNFLEAIAAAETRRRSRRRGSRMERRRGHGGDLECRVEVGDSQPQVDHRSGSHVDLHPVARSADRAIQDGRRLGPVRVPDAAGVAVERRVTDLCRYRRPDHQVRELITRRRRRGTSE